MQQSYDVVVIGGGVVGSAIARELSRYMLRVAVLEKESDVCTQTSGRNTGMLHAGFLYKTGTLKAICAVEGNQEFDSVAEELDVPFERCGQYACFGEWRALPLVWLYALQRRFVCGIDDTRIVFGRRLRKKEPKLNADFKFALYNPQAGCVCPYGLTIACGENAAANGAQISLNTAALEMELAQPAGGGRRR